jgi:DNA modification methylase
VGLPDPYYVDDYCTIYCGDSRDLLPLIDADVMVTDPPYGYAYASNHEGKWRGQQIANDADLAARDAVIEAWGDGTALVFGSWKRPRPEATREMLVWDKGVCVGMGDLRIPWGASHEDIYVLGPWDKAADVKRSGTVLRHQRPVTWSGASGQREHPNEKPIPLMRELIGKCPPGTIIDPFMGSGSTLRAAKDLGRKCIGIEVDPKWCEVAVRRLAQDNLFAGDFACG